MPSHSLAARTHVSSSSEKRSRCKYSILRLCPSITFRIFAVAGRARWIMYPLEGKKYSLWWFVYPLQYFYLKLSYCWRFARIYLYLVVFGNDSSFATLRYFSSYVATIGSTASVILSLLSHLHIYALAKNNASFPLYGSRPWWIHSCVYF